MVRSVWLPILLCFLVAIGIRATRISSHQMGSRADFIGEPSSTAQNDDSVFLITDDDESHDTPHLIQTEIDGNQPFRFSLPRPGSCRNGCRHTVLRL